MGDIILLKKIDRMIKILDRIESDLNIIANGHGYPVAVQPFDRIDAKLGGCGGSMSGCGGGGNGDDDYDWLFHEDGTIERVKKNGIDR